MIYIVNLEGYFKQKHQNKQQQRNDHFRAPEKWVAKQAYIYDSILYCTQNTVLMWNIKNRKYRKYT